MVILLVCYREANWLLIYSVYRVLCVNQHQQRHMSKNGNGRRRGKLHATTDLGSAAIKVTNPTSKKSPSSSSNASVCRKAINIAGVIAAINKGSATDAYAYLYHSFRLHDNLTPSIDMIQCMCVIG
jgi:hypothetical protein